MIRIHPLALVNGKERRINKVATDGHLAESMSSRCPKIRGGECETCHRHVLETKEALKQGSPCRAKVVRCLNLTHYHHVFDTNAIFSVGIVARFCALLVKFRSKAGGRGVHCLKLSYLALMGCYCTRRSKYCQYTNVKYPG